MMDIFNNPTWENMYNHAIGRRNLLEWIPFRGDESGLLIGDDSEVMKEFIASKIASLDIVEEKLDEFAAKGKKYDYIFSIGTLAYAEQYLPEEGTNAYETFLKLCKEMLTDEGRLVLAIPNKLGLKYFAGCREDNFGAPFTGLEDYYYHKGMRTFGKNELKKMLDAAGLQENKWYYPYPDYRFMTHLYTDEYQPKAGELRTNLVNYDQERYVFFDETKVWDTIIREGRFPEFSNSFLVITGKEPVNNLSFVKYSAERDKKYALRTEICNEQKSADEPNFYARKVALCSEGNAHIQNIEKSCRALKEQYESAGFLIDPCEVEDDSSVCLYYITGLNLQEYMEQLIIQNRHDDVKAIIDEYTRRVLSVENKVSDIDLIFSNLIVDSIDDVLNASWSVIDYEWTFDEPMDVKFILYRAYFLATKELMPSPVLDLEKLCAEVGITAEDIERYKKQEEDFQKMAIGDNRPERDMLGLIGNPIIPFAEMDRAYREESEKNTELARLREENAALKEEVSHFGIRSAIKNKLKPSK